MCSRAILGIMSIVAATLAWKRLVFWPQAGHFFVVLDRPNLKFVGRTGAIDWVQTRRMLKTCQKGVGD